MGFLAILFKYALTDYAEQFLFGAYVVSLKKREHVSKLIIALLAVDAVGGALFGFLFPEMRTVRPYIRLTSLSLRIVIFLMIFDTPVIKGFFQYLFVDIYSKTLHIPIGIVYAIVTGCDSRFIIDSVVDRVICPIITILGLFAVKYFKENYKDKRFVDLTKAGSIAYVVAIISGICAVMEKHAVGFVDEKHPMFNKQMWDISGVLISIVFITMGYMVLVANSLWRYYQNESTIRNERINLLKAYKGFAKCSKIRIFKAYLISKISHLLPIIALTGNLETNWKCIRKIIFNNILNRNTLPLETAMTMGIGYYNIMTPHQICRKI